MRVFSNFVMRSTRTSRFTIYKTLVGYDSVFPMMWENENSDPAEEDEYRKARIDEFVAEINDMNADEWFAIIRRCAQTESNDAATFPKFGEFLRKLSRAQPAVVLGYIEELDEKLTGFLGVMLAGLEESDRVAEECQFEDFRMALAMTNIWSRSRTITDLRRSLTPPSS